MADENDPGATDPQQRAARQDDVLGNGRHSRGLGGTLRSLIGDPEDRKTRAIAAGGVAVVLLLLGLVAWANGRATERKNFALFAETVAQGEALAHLNVTRQTIVDGQVVTEVTWSEVDATGAETGERTLEVAGELVHVGVVHASIKHRGLDDPLQFDYFDDLAVPDAEPLSLIDDAPGYFDYRGEREGSVRRTVRRLWDWIGAEKPVPARMTLETQEMAGLELPLLLGEQWELALSKTGQVDQRRLRSPRDAYERFDLTSPVNTNSGLELVVEAANLQVEFAETIDPDLIYVRPRVRLFNKSDAAMKIDPNRFEIQDDRQQVFRPVRTSSLTLPAGSGQTLRLRFLVPPSSRGLRFTIPGETVAGGDGTRPLAIFLQPDEIFTSGQAAVGDLMASLDGVERNVTPDGFEIVAMLTVAALTWDAKELQPKQFQLRNLRYDQQDALEVSQVSPTELDPFLPEQVKVSFLVGPVMERADQRLVVSALRKKAVYQEATFDLTPLELPAGQAQVGQTYIHQLCGARHFGRYLELTTGGARGVLGLLTDRKARDREAQRHLNLAKSYFSDSTLISNTGSAPQ